jgi:hypothetical protein
MAKTKMTEEMMTKTTSAAQGDLDGVDIDQSDDDESDDAADRDDDGPEDEALSALSD